jgi:hypothetical protein
VARSHSADHEHIVLAEPRDGSFELWPMARRLAARLLLVDLIAAVILKWRELPIEALVPRGNPGVTDAHVPKARKSPMD